MCHTERRVFRLFRKDYADINFQINFRYKTADPGTSVPTRLALLQEFGVTNQYENNLCICGKQG